MRVQKKEQVYKLWELNTDWNVLIADEKMRVDSEVEVVHYKKNDIIHRDGDEPTHMMMLVEGKVRIYKAGVGQKAQILQLLKPYDFFGYRAVIAGDKYNTFASAMEPCVVYRVPASIFLQLLRQNNLFCYQMLQWMAKDLAHSQLRMVNLTQKHIRGRIAESLIALKDRYGLDEDEATINIYISREDLANMSNMTTSNAIRTLSQFAQEGIISIDGKKIKILDNAELIRTSQIG